MRQVPILMYHWFRGARSSASRSPQLEIAPEAFERQLRHLRERGYQTVGLTQAFGPRRENLLPAKPVVITFDDGTADFWDHARPALARHDFRATLFVVTGHVGGESTWDANLGEPARKLLDWDQLEQLASEGYEIGSHTHSHRPFTEQTEETIRLELSRSRETLHEHLGTRPSFLAYPRGFYRPEHKPLVRDAGYSGACAVALGWRDLERSDDYELKRVTIKGGESLLRFRLRLLAARCVRYRSSASMDARRR